MENEKEPVLWNASRKKAMFKIHCYLYVGINIFVWSMWFWTMKPEGGFSETGMIPWPAWVTVSWGLGLYFHYRDVYAAVPKATQKEQETASGNK